MSFSVPKNLGQQQTISPLPSVALGNQMPGQSPINLLQKQIMIGMSPSALGQQSPVFRNSDSNQPSVQNPLQPFALQSVVGADGKMPWGTRK